MRRVRCGADVIVVDVVQREENSRKKLVKSEGCVVTVTETPIMKRCIQLSSLVKLRKSQDYMLTVGVHTISF